MSREHSSGVPRALGRCPASTRVVSRKHSVRRPRLVGCCPATGQCVDRDHSGGVPQPLGWCPATTLVVSRNYSGGAPWCEGILARCFASARRVRREAWRSVARPGWWCFAWTHVVRRAVSPMCRHRTSPSSLPHRGSADDNGTRSAWDSMRRSHRRASCAQTARVAKRKQYTAGGDAVSLCSRSPRYRRCCGSRSRGGCCRRRACAWTVRTDTGRRASRAEPRRWRDPRRRWRRG